MLNLIQADYAEILRQMDFTKYHLGCNALNFEGWLNIDWHPNANHGAVYKSPFRGNEDAFFLNFDLRKGIPADDSSLQYVYHSHFLEHLTFKDGINLISETSRVLQRGGKQRIVVPDLEKFARSYLGKNEDLIERYTAAEPWFKANPEYKTRGSQFMAMLYEFGHKMGWDYETLSGVLQNSGFKNIRKVEYQKSDFPDILDIENYSEIRVAESLFVECEKQ
jgi:predicted SAM-dependent methyltransferase